MSATDGIPDPALVVLVGASGSGKSTWAASRFRASEIVSSDALRAVVGSGEHDLDASADAFDLLDRIVAGRARRRLSVVVDTLGLDPTMRRAWLSLARETGLAAVVVRLAAPERLVRQRNRERDRSVPAAVLTRQLRSARRAMAEIDAEGWDLVVDVVHEPEALPRERAPRPVGRPATPGATTLERSPTGEPTSGPAERPARGDRDGPEIVLQVSRFPWGEDPSGWLRGVALAVAEAGFGGVALMDHLIQIPQVDRAWEPIPEPFVALGHLAALGTSLRLGTLCTPVTFRPAGVLAKAVATLDVLTGGHAFVGIGAGWWEREHVAYGIGFPPAREREDLLESAVETVRALWSAGTKPYAGGRVSLPETTCYPRPVGTPQILVGGSGKRRTLRTAARLGDACNLPSDPAALDVLVPLLRAHCADAGRDPDEVAVTVLDVPVVGRDREDAWARVERLRGRAAAATYAARHHAGTATEHRDRYRRLAESHGVRTVFVAVPDLSGPDDIERLAGLVP